MSAGGSSAGLTLNDLCLDAWSGQLSRCCVRWGFFSFFWLVDAVSAGVSAGASTCTWHCVGCGHWLCALSAHRTDCPALCVITIGACLVRIISYSHALTLTPRAYTCCMPTSNAHRLRPEVVNAHVRPENAAITPRSREPPCQCWCPRSASVPWQDRTCVLALDYQPPGSSMGRYPQRSRQRASA